MSGDTAANVTPEFVSECRAAYRSGLSDRKKIAQDMHDLIDHALSGELRPDRIDSRVKDPRSFGAKVESGRYMEPLSEIEDQIGCRIIVCFRHQIEQVKDVLTRVFSCVEVTEKQPENVSQFGYESLHLLAQFPHLDGIQANKDKFPRCFEIQIRTIAMHAFAEPQHGINYKNISELSYDNKRKLAAIAGMMWAADGMFEEILDEVGIHIT